MSVLERLLANAALRDEAGRLHSPEARAPPPSGVSQGVGVWSPGWVFCLCQRPSLLPPPGGQGRGMAGRSSGEGWAVGAFLRGEGWELLGLAGLGWWWNLAVERRL